MNFSALNKLTPLITVDCVLDFDVGLIRLVQEQYNKSNTFVFPRRFKEVIKRLYYRNEVNPLYPFLRDPSQKEEADTWYRQFMEECEEEIMERVISTEILDMCFTFLTSGAIAPTITFFTERQMEALLRVPHIDRLRLSNYIADKENIKRDYGQIFVKTVEQLELFKDTVLSTVYISSCGINFVNNELKELPILQDTIRRGNQISVFDIYRQDIIGERKKST